MTGAFLDVPLFLLTERPLVSRTVRIAALAVVSLATPSQAASTTGALMITHVRPNAAGADTRDGTQLNVNGEYFVIKNVTTRTVNTGGYVPDITTNTYGRALPSYNLPAGAKAYVHTGNGRNYRDSSGAHHIFAAMPATSCSTPAPPRTRTCG
ncbi:lamin tail domain-containing protein [Streptomyces sp. NPDC006551]|uniref:lamin tail domain-containing protein n=1 Tax=Streptomyces sp. NPDC006551 TaxID=3157178 RepID=UPI0033B1DC95